MSACGQKIGKVREGSPQLPIFRYCTRASLFETRWRGKARPCVEGERRSYLN